MRLGHALRALGTAALAAGVLSACGDASSADFTEPAAAFAFWHRKPVRLGDGTRLAVGSVTGHDLTLQWGDGRNWTAPVVVFRSPDLFIHDGQVAHARSTAAITVDLWTQRALDDDHDPVRTAAVVCASRTCTEPREADGLSGADVSEDGSLVAFDLGRQRMLLWERDGGLREEPITGVPRSARLDMLRDGSFAAVTGRYDPAAATCRLELSTAPRGSVTFVRAAESEAYVDRAPCDPSSLELHDDGTIGAFVESLSDEVVFVKDGDAWRERAAPGHRRMAVRDTHGETTLSVTGAGVRGVEVVIGSSDLHTIRAQTRTADADGWTAERVVAQAPAGTACRAASPTPAEEVLVFVVGCFDESRPYSPDDAREPDRGLALITRDGEHWQVEQLLRPARDAADDGHAILVASADRQLLIGAGGSVREVRLPADTPRDGLALTADGGRIVRIIGNPDPARHCRPTITVAPVDATSWPRPQPLPGVDRHLGSPPGTCSAEVWRDGRILDVTIARMDYSEEIFLAERGGRWVAVDVS